MKLKVQIFSFLFIVFYIQNGFSQEQTTIYDAIRDGNLTLVKKQIERDSVLVNTTNKNGFTPLILASYYHKTAIARLLLENRAKIDVRSDMGTALMAATYKGDNEMVELLLEYQQNVNLTDNKGASALHLACIFNFKKIAKMLLNNKADSHLKDAHNKTALDYAILNNNIEIIKLFENE
jgi:ankyrin repeat protein